MFDIITSCKQGSFPVHGTRVKILASFKCGGFVKTLTFKLFLALPELTEDTLPTARCTEQPLTVC